MIQKIRIDDRLLHGQVAFSWKSALGFDAIVIASDAAANDPMRKQVIKMCCPEGVRLAVRTVEGAAELLRNPRLEAMKVFVICPDPATVSSLLTMIDEKPAVNLGGMQSAEGRTMFSRNVYVNADDIAALDDIADRGYTIEVQEVPSTAAHDYAQLRSKFTAA
ncbi:PTS sugar transporter subunit IIB [Enorma burkinafasonensis]|uniref:PTS sugar transporter subunit IIB n=1 Tax=Enorma burkinafasonensis TaxID=2590867 RepID=UPI0011A05C77|nr:PTS sugar transporter subunit IIB [Enorma burkinafasonensis]